MAIIDIKENIKSARIFAEKWLNGQFKNVDKKDYFIFQISKFLLLKESIIKKDSKNNILYFDYEKNKKYIDVIKKIVDYARNNGIFKSNNIDINIKPEEFNSDEELKGYILDFHKIRDTFAHGAYRIDVNNGLIVLDNKDMSEDGKIRFQIQCTISIEMLELFSFVMRKPKSVYDTNDKSEFIEEINDERSKFKYDKIEKDDIINNYNLLYKDEIKNDNSFIIKNNKFKSIDSKNNNELYLKYKNELLYLLSNVIEKKEFYKSEVKRIVKLLQVYDFIDSNNDLDLSKLKLNPNPNESYLKKLAIVINEISLILGIERKSPDSIISVAAVYNYMQTFLSFMHNEIENSYLSSNLGSLKMSTISIVNKNKEYLEKVTSISRKIRNFRKKYNKNKLYIGNVKEILMNLINELIEDLAFINMRTITSIRNSLEHGNIEEKDGTIILKDLTDQNDDETILFECEGKPKDFFDIVRKIDLGIQPNEFSITDLLNEIKNLINDELYVDFERIVNEVFGNLPVLDEEEPQQL